MNRIITALLLVTAATVFNPVTANETTSLTGCALQQQDIQAGKNVWNASGKNKASKEQAEHCEDASFYTKLVNEVNEQHADVDELSTKLNAETDPKDIAKLNKKLAKERDELAEDTARLQHYFPHGKP